MKMSWLGNVSVLLAVCEGNPLVIDGSPYKEPVMQDISGFFVVQLKHEQIGPCK